jgi:hypothetical protein
MPSPMALRRSVRASRVYSMRSWSQMVLQLACFNRSREPVVMEISPVLAVEDVADGKLCALAGRVEPRDYRPRHA